MILLSHIKKKYLLSFFILVFILFSLIITIIASRQSQDIRNRAYSNKEKEIEIFGTFLVEHFDNFPVKESTDILKIKTNDNKIYKIHFSGKVPSIISGAKGSIKGKLIGENLYIQSNEKPSYSSLTREELSVQGQRRIITILINFTNDSSQPHSISEVRSALFESPGSINEFYKENTFNKISFSGDVIGYYTIPRPNDNLCAYNEWADVADQMAINDGVNVGSYDVHIYIFPTTYVCGWVGGTNGQKIWINGPFVIFGSLPQNYLEAVISHELGHYFGFAHASGLACPDKVIDDFANCTVFEYGDVTDIMGGSMELTNLNNGVEIFHNNSNYKFNGGWAPYPLTVYKNGTFTITSLETFVNNFQDIQTLRIPIPGTTDYYYIDYRQPFGFDSRLPNSIIHGVNIRIGGVYLGDKMYLIDMVPETYHNFTDASLSDGKVFYDEIHHIKISQLNHNQNIATVLVELAVPTPVLISPTPTQVIQPSLKLGWNKINWPNFDQGSLPVNCSQYSFLQNNLWIGKTVSYGFPLGDLTGITNFSIKCQ